jgi:peroxiredoxin
MRKGTFLAMVVMLISAWQSPALAAKVGELAPNFTATDSHGKTQKLSDYKGKLVVLEWHNQSCPYTRKHYESGNMQRLQKEWTGKGVVWFTVISSGTGKQGYVTADEENAYLAKQQASPTAALLDPKGEVGHLFSAKTTPHMFVIDTNGILVYDGAIDDDDSSDPSAVKDAKNYVATALTESLAGKPVLQATTRPYGCSVKYSD